MSWDWTGGLIPRLEINMPSIPADFTFKLLDVGRYIFTIHSVKPMVTLTGRYRLNLSLSAFSSTGKLYSPGCVHDYWNCNADYDPPKGYLRSFWQYVDEYLSKRNIPTDDTGTYDMVKALVGLSYEGDLKHETYMKPGDLYSRAFSRIKFLKFVDGEQFSDSAFSGVSVGWPTPTRAPHPETSVIDYRKIEF